MEGRVEILGAPLLWDSWDRVNFRNDLSTVQTDLPLALTRFCSVRAENVRELQSDRPVRLQAKRRSALQLLLRATTCVGNFRCVADGSGNQCGYFGLVPAIFCSKNSFTVSPASLMFWIPSSPGRSGTVTDSGW